MTRFFGMLRIPISLRNGFTLATHQTTTVMWAWPDARLSHRGLIVQILLIFLPSTYIAPDGVGALAALGSHTVAVGMVGERSFLRIQTWW